jgi:hypothetical protein
VAVVEVSRPQIAQPDRVVQDRAPSPVGWRFVRLTDAPLHILAIYLFMTLVLPAFLLMINSDLWPDFYRYEDFSFLPGVVVIGAVILACIFRHLLWARAGEVAVRPQAIFIYSMQNLRIVVLVLAIILAISNTLAGNTGFRYDDNSLSERGSFGLYVYAVVPNCVRLLLIFHAFIYRGTSVMDRLERALITMTFAASINGVATAFLTVFSFIALHTNARDYLFKSKIGALTYLRFMGLVAAVTVFIGVVGIVLAGAYIYGESVKREEAVGSVFDSVTGTSYGEGWTPVVLMNRLAPTYASLVNTLPLTFDFDQDSFDNLAGILNTFLFRLQALNIVQFSVERASTKSIARLNYEFIDITALNDREGTAPGLIPGFLYAFPPGLNVLMLGAYVFMALGLLQRLCLCMNEEMSFSGKFILTYFTLPLFECPVDLLLIIDDGPIFLLGLWWMTRLVEKVGVAPQQPTFSTA